MRTPRFGDVATADAESTHQPGAILTRSSGRRLSSHQPVEAHRDGTRFRHPGGISVVLPAGWSTRGMEDGRIRIAEGISSGVG
jgi:hypothetical protein